MDTIREWSLSQRKNTIERTRLPETASLTPEKKREAAARPDSDASPSSHIRIMGLLNSIAQSQPTSQLPTPIIPGQKKTTPNSKLEATKSEVSVWFL